MCEKIKILLMSILMMIAMSGCFSEKVYGTGKVLYVGAKTAYIELDVEDAKLEALDKVVVTYDKVRTAVKQETSQKKTDVTTSSVPMQ